MDTDYLNYESLFTSTSDISNEYFEKEISKSKNNLYLKLMFSYHLLSSDDPKKAEEVLSEINSEIEEPFLKSLFLMNEGLILFTKDKEEAAERKLKESLNADFDKDNKWIRLELFWFYEEKIDFEAWGYLESALKLDPQFSQAKIQKSYLLDEDANCKEIIRLLEGLPESYQDSDAMNFLGVAFVNCGDFDKAKDTIEKSINIKPTSNNYFSLGQLMHEYYNELDIAEEHYKKSLELDRGNLDAINSYAWLLYDKNNVEESENKITSLLFHTEDQEVYTQVINFYILTGKMNQAIKYTLESEQKHGVNYINDAYRIIVKILEKEDYKASLESYKSKYSEGNVDWLKGQISFFLEETGN